MPGSRGLLPTRFPPFPRCPRLRIDPQSALRRPRFLLQIPQHRLPARVLLIPPCQPSANNRSLRRPRFLLQIPQHRLPARVLLIPPCQPSANKFLVQVRPIRQNDLGGGAFAPIDVADLHRDRLSESQSPVELLGACPRWTARSKRRRGSMRCCTVPSMNSIPPDPAASIV